METLKKYGHEFGIWFAISIIITICYSVVIILKNNDIYTCQQTVKTQSGYIQHWKPLNDKVGNLRKLQSDVKNMEIQKNNLYSAEEQTQSGIVEVTNEVNDYLSGNQ